MAVYHAGPGWHKKTPDPPKRAGAGSGLVRVISWQWLP